MAQTTNINIRIDTQLKKEYETVCNDLGLSMSAAFNVFAKAVARRKAIPFELSVAEDLFFSESHQRELVRRAEDLDAGLNCITFEMDELSTFETMTQKEIAAFIQAKKKSQGIA